VEDTRTLVRRLRRLGCLRIENEAMAAKSQVRLERLSRGNQDKDLSHLLPEEISVSIEEKVVEIVSEQLGVPKEEISRESSFVDDLKADSLDVVELVMEFEDDFDVSIPDDDYEKIRTVGDAIDYIEEKS